MHHAHGSRLREGAPARMGVPMRGLFVAAAEAARTAPATLQMYDQSKTTAMSSRAFRSRSGTCAPSAG